MSKIDNLSHIYRLFAVLDKTNQKTEKLFVLIQLFRSKPNNLMIMIKKIFDIFGANHVELFVLFYYKSPIFELFQFVL